METALERAGLSMSDLARTVGTGYGRKRIPFADRVESEIACHARGAWWRAPVVRTVIDIGGQDAKAIKLDDRGRVIRFIYNDKCASGTGRFLEIMAEALEVEIEGMAELASRSTQRIGISSQCVVFAETEIISLVNAGRSRADIVAGLHQAMAGRVASLARSIEVVPEVALTGGVAKNPDLVRAMEETLGIRLAVLDGDPQINGALGAALLASEMDPGSG